ncbi:hypothetical protein [Flavobacterium davisii]|uniref:Uncharacterized protein n=1 Tax=Flavobacterium columnare TaxID=996 RepID=A0A8G0KVK8_9FLAO|nr:hypothetical protein [Flavobacterium davisii]QYS89229.1 hypothetical protein JJC05_02120 [Flavobacterium davisii]
MANTISKIIISIFKDVLNFKVIHIRLKKVSNTSNLLMSGVKFSLLKKGIANNGKSKLIITSL